MIRCNDGVRDSKCSREVLFLVGSFVIGLAATSFLNASLAHDGDDHDHKGKTPQVRKVANAELYAPTPMPDRIVLTWSGDPTTSQSVTWRTSTEVVDGLAEIALATSGPEFVKSATRVKAESVALKTDLNTAHFHSVVFKDLTPGTKYTYRVGDGVNWSEWFQFRTANITPEPFSFVYFGDAQNDLRSLWSRVIREAYSDAPKARFLLHAGDLINTAQSDAEWGEWFGGGAWLNATIPNVPVVGNHEMHKGSDGVSRLTHHWRPQFTLPQQGPEGLEETCFTFVYQNCRFVVLNSNTKLKEQAVWLDKVLEENVSPWIVCSFHHPVFSTAKNRDNPTIRNQWKPILDKYNVDLVLQGHDHSYARTGLETPTGKGETASTDATPPSTIDNVATGVTHRDEHFGTVYVVSVSGPKMYNLDRKSFMVRVAEDTQLYQVIHIDGMSLRYESRTATGELYDAFELSKTIGEPNKLKEIPVEMAERRRASSPAPAAPSTPPNSPALPAVPATGADKGN